MKQPISLYIHIPFCMRKCSYCDFLSFSGCSEQLQKDYMHQLFREMDYYKEIAKDYRVQTIFIGGGTPSLLQEGLMEQLFQQIYSIWRIEEGAEITIESNPRTLSVKKLIEYRTCGINRLSIGLQSADNEELKRLGRIHNYEQFVANYKLAREAGFQNINVDIMAALPGQTQSSFGKTLAKVVDLKPEHISVYSLIVEEGTPLAENHELLSTLPTEVTERRMYKYTKSILNSMGYERYEISNYAKPGYACRHNQVYWKGGEYLGFGLGAASYWNGMRFENTKDMQEYMADWTLDDISMLRKNVVLDSRKSQMEEFMFLGLRLMQGVSKEEFQRRFDVPMEEVYGKVIQTYVEQGLLTWNQEYLRLTDAGIDVSNVVMADFLLEAEEIF
ncbi:MAG: oxygen-independent coproporphyrinogen III oxidase [Lachnospiraceae bacterium]|nr:oxygen-independent coproporphyrinogen III oxidase [Lachnospiraceae bacterium]